MENPAQVLQFWATYQQSEYEPQPEATWVRLLRGRERLRVYGGANEGHHVAGSHNNTACYQLVFYNACCFYTC